jgi:lysyl-tRNA synthetase class 2
MPARNAILAPSDLARIAPGSEVLVGGRVRSSDSNAVVVIDAFGAVEVALAVASEVAPGDLVVMAGRVVSAARGGDVTRMQLLGGRVCERIVPNVPPRFAEISEGATGGSETWRLHGKGVGPHLALRAAAHKAIREFFEADSFVEVDTPSMVPSPGLDLHLDAFEISKAGRRAERPMFLLTSPEYQMKRLLCGGVPRCFQIARCFRRGEDGPRHRPEFSMLEWYRAFAGIDAIIDDTERLVRHVAERLVGGLSVNAFGRRVDLGRAFERLPLAAAFERYAGLSGDAALALADEDEERFFRVLVDAVEPGLAREDHGVVVIDYPARHASLARIKPSDRRVCERFELYVGGVELCNGFGELTDAAEQRARLERDRDTRARAGKPVYPLDERFLAALDEGMPPAGGNALGLDRLLLLCAGAASLAEVQSFPMEWL